MEGYARHFGSVSLGDLDDYFAGRWSKPVPGLIPVLYEGFRDAVDVMVPILEEFGFVGWLFVPSHFPNVPVAEQRSFAAANSLYPARTDEYPGERMTLSWDEAREVAKRHVFACHSRTHSKIDPDTDPAILHDQIVVAKAEIEEGIGVEVSSFAWLYGTEAGVNPVADRMLVEAGFKYLFSNFKIQKLK